MTREHDERTRVPSTDTHDDKGDQWEIAHTPAAGVLDSWVNGYSDYREKTGSFCQRRELPSMRPVLIVNLAAPISVVGADGVRLSLAQGEAFVAGPQERHALSESTGEQAGLHVWLTMRGFQRLLGGRAGGIANRAVRLDDVLGASVADLGIRLGEAPDRAARFAFMDRALAGMLGDGQDMRPELSHAFARLRAGHAVHAVARDIGWSRKTLNQHFRSRFGLSPKTASRLARFDRAVAACGGAPRPHWAAIAQDAGYADQSHLIRDFLGFAGMTPAEYRRRLLPEGGGLPESQSAIDSEAVPI